MEPGQRQLAAVIIVALIIISVVFFFVIYPRYIADDDDGGGGGGGEDNINKAPVARIKTNATGDTRVGDPIEFNATTSTDSDGEIILYRWDFGDGTEKAGSQFFVINHTYSYPGEKVINLTVQDEDGAKGYDTLTINIRQSDYSDSASAFLSSQDYIPIDWPENATFYFPIENDVMEAVITFTFTGWSGSQDENFTSKVDIIFRTPAFAVIEQKTVEVRGQANETFIFLDYDLPIKTGANYIIDVKCTVGTILVDYEVDVLY